MYIIKKLHVCLQDMMSSMEELHNSLIHQIYQMMIN